MVKGGQWWLGLVGGDFQSIMMSKRDILESRVVGELNCIELSGSTVACLGFPKNTKNACAESLDTL